MPLYLKQKAGYTYSLQPSFCQYWGILFVGGDLGNAYKTYSHRRKVVKAIVDAIPPEIKWFLHGFAPEFDYPHPFHWAGYTLQTRYTYQLELGVGYATIEKNFGNDTRYDIRKAVGEGCSVGATLAWQRLTDLVDANNQHAKRLLSAADLQTLERLGEFLSEFQIGTGLGSR